MEWCVVFIEKRDDQLLLVSPPLVLQGSTCAPGDGLLTIGELEDHEGARVKEVSLLSLELAVQRPGHIACVQHDHRIEVVILF